ncbi:MAG: 3-phosphoshikimate 1-carboxyvinyltransferase, partial [Eubacterium sp.]|nr:3-phosphoshikimate 1-carboxyvinyltransferase [Eubacterium sp.]
DGILRVLQDMDADISVENVCFGGEPSADLVVRSAALHGTTIAGDLIPTLIDEIPVLAIAAAFADGTTVIRDAAELKVKESDRIALVSEGLQRMGADVEPTEDGMIIHGGKPLHGAQIDTHGDHRIAMAFSIAALLADGETTLTDADCVDISYPGFYSDLEALQR